MSIKVKRKPSLETSIEDSLDFMLTRVATPVAKPEVERSGRKSRFFFRRVEDEVASLKQATKPKEVELDNAESIAYALGLKKLLLPVVKTNIETVRDFFINEIAPLSLALGAGALQASEAIKEVTGSGVEPSTFDKFDRMCHQAVILRMASFLEGYLGLKPGEGKELLPVALRVKQDAPVEQVVPDSEPAGNRKENRDLRRLLTRALESQGGKHGPVEG